LWQGCDDPEKCAQWIHRVRCFQFRSVCRCADRRSDLAWIRVRRDRRCRFPLANSWRMPLSRTRCATVFRSWALSVLKLLESCRSRGRLGRSLRLPIPVKRFHQARRLGQFDPGMALRHEGFRLAQLGDDIFGRLDRAGGVPQSGLRRVIFPANELTKIRFAGGSPVRGGPWGYTIHSSLWT